MMTRPRKLPCKPQLDELLENYYDPEGPSIRSVMSQAPRGATAPTTLRECDVRAETFDLIVGLSQDEVNAVREYYLARVRADELTAQASEARQEVRNRQRRGRFKTAMAEIQRKWDNKKPLG